MDLTEATTDYISVLLFIKRLEAGMLNKTSCLAAALGVTQVITVISTNLVTLCCAA
jgi:hypothetical protein